MNEHALTKTAVPKLSLLLSLKGCSVKNNPLGDGSAAVLAPTDQNALRYGGVFLRLGGLDGPLGGM